MTTNDWQQRAKCRGKAPAYDTIHLENYINRPGPTSKARLLAEGAALCEGCPVIKDCATWWLLTTDKRSVPFCVTAGVAYWSTASYPLAREAVALIAAGAPPREAMATVGYPGG